MSKTHTHRPRNKRASGRRISHFPGTGAEMEVEQHENTTPAFHPGAKPETTRLRRGGNESRTRANTAAVIHSSQLHHEGVV